MGNAASPGKSGTKIKVQLSIRNFRIQRLPSKWHHVDDEIWTHLHDSCRAAIPEDVAQRKKAYNAWRCYYISGILLFLIGILYGLAAGYYGYIKNKILIWGTAIIISIGFICIGSVFYKLGKKRKRKRGKIYKQFIDDVSSNLDTLLSTLNTKYNGVIRFTNKGIAKSNVSRNKANKTVTIDIKIQKLKSNPNKQDNINIKINILSNDVPLNENRQISINQPRKSSNAQYTANHGLIPHPQPIMMQPAPPNEPPQKGHMIMVQMADGRTVPAQIQSQMTASYDEQIRTQRSQSFNAPQTIQSQYSASYNADIHRKYSYQSQQIQTQYSQSYNAQPPPPKGPPPRKYSQPQPQQQMEPINEKQDTAGYKPPPPFAPSANMNRSEVVPSAPPEPSEAGSLADVTKFNPMSHAYSVESTKL